MKMNFKHIGIAKDLRIIIFLLIFLSPGIFKLYAQPKQFEVLGRRTFTEESSSVLGISKTNAISSYKFVNTSPTKTEYRVQINGGAFNIGALSNIEYAGKANRVITFGDSLNRHVATNVYANIYSGTGALIKALGLVASWPFATSYSGDGHFIVAGNKNQQGSPTSISLTSYDPDGNKQWERALPDLMPVNVYSAAGNAFIAVVLYNKSTRSAIIQYYNNSGNLILEDNSFMGVSAIEFLPGGKVVLTTGDNWFLYKLTGGYTRIASGKLKGNSVGRYPITAHPAKDIFYIVSVKNSPSNNGHRIQAFNGSNGQLIAEKEFDGEVFWQPYRLAEAADNDNISLLISKELIELRMSQ